MKHVWNKLQTYMMTNCYAIVDTQTGRTLICMRNYTKTESGHNLINQPQIMHGY